MAGSQPWCKRVQNRHIPDNLKASYEGFVFDIIRITVQINIVQKVVHAPIIQIGQSTNQFHFYLCFTSHLDFGEHLNFIRDSIQNVFDPGFVFVFSAG